MNIQERLDYLEGIKFPEVLFGKGDLDSIYKKWALLVHPDKHDNDPVAAKAFKILTELKMAAELKKDKGTYGDLTALAADIIIKGKSSSYILTHLRSTETIHTEYLGKNDKDEKVILKITRNPKNNDLMLNEAKILTFLRDKAPTKDLDAMAHIPLFVESFIFLQDKERRQVNVMKAGDNFFTLQQIIDAYPDGLDPRDAAWMFNRLIGSLVVSHQAKIVNAGVLPNQFVVNIKTHNGILKNWFYSVDRKSTKNVISAIDENYREYYSKEVFEKKKADYSVDIYMAATTLLKLLGGNINTGQIPDSVPVPIQGLVRAWRLGQAHRTRDIWEVHKDFNEVLERLYGPKTFRVFKMPEKV